MSTLRSVLMATAMACSIVPSMLSADTFDDDPAKAIQRFVNDALQAAGDIPEPYERAQALAEIAVIQSKTEAREAAKQTLQSAVKTARMLPADTEKQARDRCTLLFSIAYRVAYTHDWAGARALADDIVANEPIRQFGVPKHEVYSFLQILIYVQARAGQLDEAVKTAEADPAYDFRDRIQQEKAEQQAEAKNWAQALKLAAEIKDSNERAWTLPRIAILQHQAGEKESARRTLGEARKLLAGLQSAHLNEALASAYLKTGDRETALQIAEAIKNTTAVHPAREQALSQLHAEMGEFATALQFARKVREINPRSEYSFRRVAELQAKAKQFKDAWRTVGEMKEGYPRTQATLAIAEEQHRAGKTEDAAESFRAALRTAEKTSVPESSGFAFASDHAAIFQQIARTQAELGEFAAAHTWIRRQFSPKNQAYAYVGVAEGLHARLQKKQGAK